jgi:beta-lactam-binding protein with PASTA domain
MLPIFTDNSKRAFVANLLMIISLYILLMIVFFNFLLPKITHHGESITVPDLRNYTLDEVKKILEDKELEYVISDSIDRGAKPLSVLQQKPSANSKVKLNRKIYLTIQRSGRDLVDIPPVIGGSLKNAENQFRLRELKVGNRTFVDDPAAGLVLALVINGKEYSFEDMKTPLKVPRGSTIDIVAGNGLEGGMMNVPNLMGMPLDEAEFYIIGVGLVVGDIKYKYSNQAKNTVIYQKPYPRKDAQVKVGQIIELVVSDPSLDASDSTLNE